MPFVLHTISSSGHCFTPLSSLLTDAWIFCAQILSPHLYNLPVTVVTKLVVTTKNIPLGEVKVQCVLFWTRGVRDVLFWTSGVCDVLSCQC